MKTERQTYLKEHCNEIPVFAENSMEADTYKCLKPKGHKGTMHKDAYGFKWMIK